MQSQDLNPKLLDSQALLFPSCCHGSAASCLLCSTLLCSTRAEKLRTTFFRLLCQLGFSLVLQLEGTPMGHRRAGRKLQPFQALVTCENEDSWIVGAH